MKFGTVGVYGNPEKVIDKLIECLHSASNEEVWERVYPFLQQVREDFVKMKWKSLGQDVVDPLEVPELITPGSAFLSEEETERQRREWIFLGHLFPPQDANKSYMITDGKTVSIGRFYDDVWHDPGNVLEKITDCEDPYVTHFKEMHPVPLSLPDCLGEKKNSVFNKIERSKDD